RVAPRDLRPGRPPAGAYETVLRRTRDPATRSRASSGYGLCAIQLGQEALTVDQAEVAARWFSKAAGFSSGSMTGRRALVGLGDARIKLGDILGAAIAYQDAIDSEATDSISIMARQRLTALGNAANGN